MKLFPDIRRTPDAITLITENESTRFQNRDTVELRDAALSVKNGTVSLTAGNTPVKAAVLRWNGRFPADTRFCGDHWERGYGDLEWRGFVPHRVMPWFFYALAGDRFALYGVKTRPDALCAFRCDTDGISLHIDVSCGADGTVLGGRTLTCCEIVCKERGTDDPFKTACTLTALLAEGAILPGAPVYGFNNWYFAYGRSSEADILASAKELSALTQGLENRPFLVIDDCWQKERPTGFIGGDWRASNAAFPDMAALAQKISAMDVKPGIWMRPLQNRASYIPASLYRNAEEEALLDPSLDETLNIVAEDIRTLVGWGYRLIKHDYSTNDITDAWGHQREIPLVKERVHFADRSRTTAQIVKRLYETIYRAADGKALILGCNVIGHLGVGLMELNRTGDDTSGREWERTRRMGVNTLAFRMPQHRAFYFADADCVGLTPAVPWEKNRQWLDLLANSGTPLFVSVAPDSLNTAQKAELKAALATASKPLPAAEPLDWLNDCCPANWRFGSEEKRYSWY